MMKYLKYLLGVIAVSALIFFGRGLMTPNVSYSTEITVDKSIEEAWAVMNDQSKTKEWLKDLTEIEHVSGERNSVGAVTKYTFEQNGESSLDGVTLWMYAWRPGTVLFKSVHCHSICLTPRETVDSAVFFHLLRDCDLRTK